MNQIRSDLLRFLKSHWPHVLLAVPAVVAFTALHELAHCAAVWMQGGTVTEFVWLPTGAKWGHMCYTFPPHCLYSAAAVSLAPYICWTACCLCAGLLAMRSRPYRFWVASTIFVWLFIVPLADIAHVAFPYVLWNADNDLRSAFGPATLPVAAALAAAGLVAAALGFILQRRLYRERSIAVAAYCLLAATAGIIILAFTCGRMR